MRTDLLRSLLRHSRDIHIPRDCVFCAQALSSREWGLCQPCQEDLRATEPACRLCLIPLPIEQSENAPNTTICGQCLRRPPVFDRCTISALYQPPISHLIARYKYSASFHSGRILAKLMADEIIASSPTHLPACIVPVPLHWSRQLSRGFNQSTLLAFQVRASLGQHYHLDQKTMPVANHILSRRSHTLSQVTQGLHGRRVNVRGAFELRSRQLLPRSVAIVDDVVTTGATVNEIAHLLKQAGVENVEVWAAARTP